MSLQIFWRKETLVMSFLKAIKRATWKNLYVKWLLLPGYLLQTSSRGREPSLADVSSTEHNGSEWAFSATAIEISRSSAKPYVHAACELGSSRKMHKLVPEMIKELSLLIYFSHIYRHLYRSYF